MPSRTEALILKLERGIQHTREVFTTLQPEQWQMTVYANPAWNAHNLLAHFVSAEQRLLTLAQDIANGGRGVSEGLFLDTFNAEEQGHFDRLPIPVLLENLESARRQTITWVKTLRDEQLDRLGRHPALGEVTVETMIQAMVGHQLIHLRDLSRSLRNNPHPHKAE